MINKFSTVVTGSLLVAAIWAHLMGAQAQAAPFLYDGPSHSSIDEESPGVTVTLNITDHFTIADLDASFRIAESEEEGHEQFWNYASNVDIYLEHMGTQVLLFEASDDAETYFDVTFDDESGNGFAPRGDNLLGTYRPDNPLSAFDGQDIFGEWNVTFIDRINPQDDTHLISWSLFADSDPLGGGAGGEPIPEPGTLALLGLGAAAAGLAKRRRQKRAAA